MLATWGTSTGRNPTLDLQFAGATSLDNRITFSRGSQATLFDSTGALVYAKHNLALQSQTFQTTWVATRINVSADAATAPDGTLTADKLIATSVAGSHTISQNVSVTLQAYTFSLYAKKGEYDFVQLNIPDPGAGGAGKVGSFDLATGTLGTVQDAGVTRTITAVGDGWYRCTVTFTPTGAGTSAIGIFVTQTDVRAESFTGNNISGIFIWGAQLNQTPMEGGVTSSLSTYYPTVASAYYAPRFDYNPDTLAAQGLLIEEQRTNSIRNNTMQGAAAGTPGTLPTNWSVAAAAGLTTNVIGTGTSNGITYVDVQITGTATSTTYILVPELDTQIAAANGQTWTMSAWWSIVGGTLTNVTDYFFDLREADSGGVQLTSGQVIVAAPTATFTRITATRTLNQATTAFVQPRFRFTVTNATAVNFTLRIGLPQLEQGAFATSVIPTTTTALTRNADVASMTGTNFSSWYNQTEGTLFTQAQDMSDATHSSAQPRVASINNGTNSTIDISRFSTSAQGRARIDDAGVTQFNSLVTAWPLAAQAKIALAYKLNDAAACLGGTTVYTDNTVTIPTVNTLTIGNYVTGSTNSWTGWIQRISYYPVRLPNSTLQALTA